MQELRQVAAAIDLRMRQLEGQGIKGAAVAEPMFGYMAGLQRIYDTASDETLADLCNHYPGFQRYAELMEAMSEQDQKMLEAGTHPYADLPPLPAPLKHSLEKLMVSAVELERSFQSAVDSGRFADHATGLAASRNRWADDLKRLVHMFQSSDVPLRGQAVVQQTLRAMAERISRLG